MNSWIQLDCVCIMAWLDSNFSEAELKEKGWTGREGSVVKVGKVKYQAVANGKLLSSSVVVV
jgi:hypothetical protein